MTKPGPSILVRVILSGRTVSTLRRCMGNEFLSDGSIRYKLKKLNYLQVPEEEGVLQTLA
jgi:hypothetical protein